MTSLDEPRPGAGEEDLGSLRRRRPRTFRADAARYLHWRPVLAALTVFVAGLLLLVGLEGVGMPDYLRTGLLLLVVFPLVRLAAAVGARRTPGVTRDDLPGSVEAPDPERAAALVAATPVPEPSTLVRAQRWHVVAVVVALVIAGLFAWAVVAPWGDEPGEPEWLLRAGSALMVVVLTGLAVHEMTRGRRSFAAASRTLAAGPPRHVGRVIGETGTKPVLLLAEPPGVHVVLRAESSVVLELDQGDDIVLDGELANGGRVYVSLAGEGAWSRIERVVHPRPEQR